MTSNLITPKEPKRRTAVLLSCFKKLPYTLSFVSSPTAGVGASMNKLMGDTPDHVDRSVSSHFAVRWIEGDNTADWKIQQREIDVIVRCRDHYIVL